MDGKDFTRSCSIIPPPSDIGLEITFHWIGHQRTSSGTYFFDGMKRGDLRMVIWQYTIAGCGMVRRDGKYFPVPPGSAFLLTLPDRHTYYLPDEPGEWEFLYLSMSGSSALRIARELQKIHGVVSQVYASAPVVELVGEVFRRGLARDLNDPAEASYLAYRLMMLMASGNSAAAGSSKDDLLTRMHQYCLEHLAENIGIDDMADFAGFSRSHFCRVFRAEAGKSPYEYLMELRAHTALRMLQAGNVPVKEVAFACGFAETGYFCKVFRKFFHTTPAAFRKKGDPR